MKARISEIFFSLQGEGIYQGKEQVFVRFFGCNLKCVFCDTKLKNFLEMDLEEVKEKILSYKNYHSVSFTGGEPLLHVNFIKELSTFLKKKNKKTYLETNGTLYKELSLCIDNLDIIAMDFKLPSSTFDKAYWKQHKEFLEIAKKRDVFVKIVIGKFTKEKELLEAIGLIKKIKPSLFLVLQPQNPYEELLKEKLNSFLLLCKKNKINAKVIPQIHKILGIK